MEIGSRIRELRKQHGLTIKQLAGKINLSQPYLSQIERDDRPCPPGALKAILEALDVTPAQFFDERLVRLPDHLKALVDEVRDLPPDQVQQLAQFLATIKKRQG